MIKIVSVCDEIYYDHEYVAHLEIHQDPNSWLRLLMNNLRRVIFEASY